MTGIRKVIHVKKGPNKNSILLPVSFKNGTDIRSIKIIKPSAMTTKSPKILMAASTLLQEYKQNEMMKNITTPAPKQTTTTITAMTATTPEQQRYGKILLDPPVSLRNAFPWLDYSERLWYSIVLRCVDEKRMSTTK